MKKCTIITLAILGTLGVLLLVAGIVLVFESDKIVHNMIEENVKLKNGSTAFKNWESPPAAIHMQFWVFNVTNPEEVIEGGEKPNVTQHGPYTYREVREKKDVDFLSNDTLISYRETKAYVFVPEMSVGPDNQSLTMVNLPILAAAAMLKKWVPGLVQSAVAALLSREGERLFEEHTVHEFLWGYKEKTLEKLNAITSKLGYNFSTTVGLFTGATKNGSDDGFYSVFSGEDDVLNVNQVNTWKNKTSLPNWWKTPYCNMLNGTDGSLWHPYVNKSERLYIFSSDICRSIYVDYNMTNDVRGIQTYHFVPPPTVFMDHIKNPANEGFCVPECLESGVLDVSVCKSAPIIVSQPHFYQGSPNYINAISGMKPESDFATFMDIEPYTGAALKVAKKLQLNAKITNLKAFKDTAKFNMTIFPMLWLNESAMVDTAGANKFKAEVFRPMQILKGSSYAAIVVGGLLILGVLIFVIVYLVRNREKDEPLISQDEPRGDI